MTWSYELAVSVAGSTMDVLAADITYSPTWSPQWRGTVTVPGTSWTAFTPLERHPVQLHITRTSAAGTSSTTTHRFWLRAAERDLAANTRTLHLASAELVLQETTNRSIGWRPAGVGPYTVDGILLDLLAFEGLSAAIPVAIVGPGKPLSFDDIELWRKGEQAWAWWDRVRLLGEASYYYDTLDGGLVLTSAGPTMLGTVPADVLEHRTEYLPDGYADSLTVNWRWGIGNATSVWAGATNTSRRRRHVELDRLGPPVAGYPQRAVDAMSEIRSQHTVVLPLTYERAQLLTNNAGWTEYRWLFGDDPTLTATILTATV